MRKFVGLSAGASDFFRHCDPSCCDPDDALGVLHATRWESGWECFDSFFTFRRCCAADAMARTAQEVQQEVS